MTMASGQDSKASSAPALTPSNHAHSPLEGTMNQHTSPRETIVKIGIFPPELQPHIDREFHCVDLETALGDSALKASIRGVITRSSCQVPLTSIESFPRLRVIATSGVGYDGIPVAAAHARGIVVTNTPGVLDAAVCELAIGLLLSMLRQIPQADSHVKSGAWERGAYPLTTSLQGLKVGIVGLGRIGKGIAKRLEPFGVELAYVDAWTQASPWKTLSTVEELAQYSDVLVVCCKGGDETRHLINQSVLKALGAGWLVNVARGSVVDESALCVALTEGSLRGAALDVFEEEPLGESILRKLPNVLLSPHAGSATHETRLQMLELTLKNLRAVLGGQPALTPVPGTT